MTLKPDPYAVFAPLPTVLIIGGENIEITPLRVGDLPAFARAVQPIAQQLSVSPHWLALLGQHGEALITILSIATRRPPEWVQSLELDAAVALCEGVFAINADFFLQRVQPMLLPALARLSARMPGPLRSNG